MPHVPIRSEQGDYEIYYRLFDSDEERPQVVLLMGLGGIHGLWKFQFERLRRPSASFSPLEPS